MLGINYKLAKYAEDGNMIKIGMVGAGQMGRGMASQMFKMKGLRPAIIVARHLDSAKSAYLGAGVHEDDIKTADNAAQANTWISQGKVVVSDNPELVSRTELIDVSIDATGNPEVGAKVAYDAILHGKHVVMLNVETDVVIGPLLYKMANSAGVVYTGSAGDEPGAVMELFDFADAMGLDVRVLGKGKNNGVVPGCNPDSVKEEAERRGMAPKMLCSFKDGTKTMVELTAMANATGFVPDVRGGHGAIGTVEELPQIYRLKSEGGILNRYQVVDYINGVAPGVYAIVSTDNRNIREELEYISMGPGPNYVLYRPFHLISLETGLSAARAVLDHQPTIVPRHGQVAETITVAKRDLKSGEYLDGIGGFTVYGTIETREISCQENALPLGLINKKTRMKRDVRLGQIIRYDDVEIDHASIVVQLRKLQEQLL